MHRRPAYRHPRAGLAASIPRMILALAVVSLLSVSLVTCGLDAMSRSLP